MSFELLGVASQSPNYFVSQEETARFAVPLCSATEEQGKLLKALYRRTRIRQRASCLLEETRGSARHVFYPLPTSEKGRGPSTGTRMLKYAEHAGNLAVAAARSALNRASLPPNEISHLITVSCTGFVAPGIDYKLINELPLSPETDRTQIGFMGCQAGLNALRVGSALSLESGGNVLIASVELCSLHFQYGWEPEQLVSNALFADGAGAIVAGPGEGTQWKLAGSGSFLLADSEDSMTWRIGDHGFEMTLSAQVPILIESHLATWLDTWLENFALSRDQVGSWAIHPGGPRILSATEKALNISSAKTRISREILSCYGNMSSATLFFLLEKSVQDRVPLPCVALGFGPGLTIEAALFTE